MRLVNRSEAVHGTDLVVQRVAPLEVREWDRLIGGFSDCSFFHTSGWAAVLQNTYGFEPAYFCEFQKGALVAALPVMEVDSWMKGRHGVSLPFSDICSPLGAEAGSEAVVAAAVAYGRERKWTSIEFRSPNRMCVGHQPSVSFLGHSLDLTAGEKKLFASFDSSVRRAIRKADRAGVVVTFSQELTAVETFYKLYCTTRKRHGLPPQPFAFFANIQRHVLAKDMGIVVCATVHNRPIAAAVFFHTGQNAAFKYGASDEAEQQFRGNNAVMWQALQWYSRRGFSSLDMGRSSLWNEGLRRYKLGWGCDERRIDYFKLKLDGGGFVSDKDETQGWHTKILHLLPMPVLRGLGAVLYKHWA